MSRLVAALCLSLVPLPLFAASGPPLSPEALAARADRVVVAHVTHVRTEGEGSGLRTLTGLQVLQDWKGQAGTSTVEVVQLGGAAGGYILQVAGDARLEPATKLVAFLRCRDKARADRCTLVGLSQGALKVYRSDAGDEVVVRDAKGTKARMPLETLRKRLSSSPQSSSVPPVGGEGPVPRVLVPKTGRAP